MMGLGAWGCVEMSSSFRYGGLSAFLVRGNGTSPAFSNLFPRPAQALGFLLFPLIGSLPPTRKHPRRCGLPSRLRED